ncbi:cation-translocating P-type ATPase [Sporomusa malonica]|uniref:P-type Ca(2+) transporter n=1 Tax=Sporomusa malonica TaxID=112901 RepID=A0A1W2DQL1_9FIRM|nr:HAD-IC family P-type ATPase [Sporomusa malonica]SMC99721.1 Ca2+-transporting ATPase [Sporomusa malonica]
MFLSVDQRQTYRLLPGRLRVSVPGLCHNKQFARFLTEQLASDHNIISISANYLTGRALIHFDQNRLGVKEIQQVLTQAWGRFCRGGNSLEINLQQFADGSPSLVALPVSNPQIEGISYTGSSKLWHSESTQSVCDFLKTSDNFGLSDREAAVRLKEWGSNKLVEGKRASFWELLGNQFKDFMVQVLLGTAGISFVLGKRSNALLTGSIVVANAVLGVIQERKAEQSIESLQKLAAPQARVIRAGRVQKVTAENLIPGDLIILEAGDRVPADARLITAVQFATEEASLTGETVPAKKDPRYRGNEATTLGDRKNMVFMGTGVTRGRATAIVVATGMKTEMGRIASLIQHQTEAATPLQCKLEQLGKSLVYGCLAVSGFVMVSGIIRGQGFVNMLQTAASLAVAAIPEGLTAIVIIALAMGVQRMSKRNIIIRQLSSVETLGCATVICSDKTGTLTKNEMTARMVYTHGRKWQVAGEGYTPVGDFFIDGGAPVNVYENAELYQTLLTGALCNNARLNQSRASKEGKVLSMSEHRNGLWTVEGDPTEGAILVAAAKAGLWRDELEKSFIRVYEYPFESERRIMSTVYKTQVGDMLLNVKGAADRVLAACTHYLRDGEVRQLNDAVRAEIMCANDEMANKALRVLACAYRLIEEFDENSEEEPEQELIFCGLLGMIDPPRPEVPPAIAKCRQAGVKVLMITGDHQRTASAVAREIGLLQAGDGVLLGSEIDRMSDKQLTDAVETNTVFARTSPHHKLRIVKALKQRGYVVAMTGDGVNDAPAVKAADIGIAMGIMGTDVTKEAASMTLADDNFATIVHAMEEGRSIYANIRKAIRYLLATNIGEVVLMLLAALMGLPLPLIPIQLLWINLVGDGLPAVALVNDPPAQDIMRQPPRTASDSVFAGGLGTKVLARGFIIGLTSLLLYMWKLRSTGNLVLARTLVLVQLAISQFVHIFDCRGEKQTGSVGLFSNLWLVAAVALSLGMVAASVHLPLLQSIFGTVPLSAGDWGVATAMAVATGIIDAGISRVRAISSLEDTTCSAKI